MGNQGGSNPLLDMVQNWIDEDKTGKVAKVQVWTNRPVWPQVVYPFQSLSPPKSQMTFIGISG